MTLAQKVKDIAIEASAVTFYGAYAMMPDGRNVQLPQGVQEHEKRNTDGRCTMARYLYADGSRLTFRWSPEKTSFTVH